MMREWLRISCAAALLVAGCARSGDAGQATEELVERGRYLVLELGRCDGCHTPHLGPGQPDMSRSLHGRELGARPEYERFGDAVTTYAPAIAGIPAHYTEEQFVSFLVDGVRPDGSTARPLMPSMRLHEEDARAIAAYIKTLPPAP